MALEASSLTVGYGDTLILRNIHFRVEAGSFSCLLGPNGAGKSTLLRALVGTHPSQGMRKLDGAPMTELGPRKKAQLLGYLPQEIQPAFSLTVAESVELGARVAAKPVSIESSLRSVDAKDLLHRHLNELSGGERRRVLLAGVLAQQPRYLLLDEPAAMLDLGHQAELFDHLRKLSKRGLGILCVTHDVNLAAQFADQLHFLTPSAKILSGTPTELLTDAPLRETFGHRFEILPRENHVPVIVPR